MFSEDWRIFKITLNSVYKRIIIIAGQSLTEDFHAGHKTFGFKDHKLWFSAFQSGVKGFIWIHPVKREGSYLSIPPVWTARG